ncbi:hypothetical protein F5I97DRAFT_1808457, partial [Phlebopus sp. FC_14]
LKLHLSIEYKVFIRVIDVLTSNVALAIAPIVYFVVNINIYTEVHWDTKDLNLCFILVIRDFIGEKLVMMEQRLVLDL